MKKRLLSTLLALCMVLSLLPPGTVRAANDSDIAYPVTGGNIYFNAETGTLTDCDITVTAANIPSTINGIAVTSIGDYAFDECSRLTSLIIPEGVEYLGEYIIRGTSISSITVPSTIISVNSGGAMVPGAPDYMNIGPFTGCDTLIEVVFAQGTKKIVDGICISGGFGDHFDYYTSYIENIVIPDGVKEIGVDAFAGCTNLTHITIPDSVEKIDAYAFGDCSKLSEITLSKKLQVIDNSAFSNCTSLKKLDLPEGITHLGTEMISGTSIESLIIPASVTECEYRLTGGYYDAHYVGVLTGCDALKKVIFAEGVTNVPDGACITGGIVDVVLPSTVATIGEMAFAYCSNLTGVTIPNSVTSIGEDAFRDCNSLTSVTIPGGVNTIGSGAFFKCSSLTSVTILNGVTSIESSAFDSCSSLTSVTIPGSVTSIGEYAFSYCSSLISATILNGVTTIGHGAFEECSSLTSVTIPDSVTSIEYAAFYSCGSLADVYYSGSEADWEAITIDSYRNSDLTNAKIHYNSTGVDANDKITFNGHQYLLINQGMTWLEAKDYCESLGGHLVTITSQAEQDFLYETYAQKYGAFMIGLSDAEEEGVWKWVTGEPFVYSNWDSGEANNENVENYVLMYRDGKWNDGHLDVEKWIFVCEWDTAPGGEDVSAYYIAPMDFGDLVVNNSGEATAWFCVKDENGNTLSERDLQYVINGGTGLTAVTTDSNGLVGITTPHLTTSASFYVVFSTDNGIDVYNEGQYFEVTVKKLSYSQEWTGVYNAGVSFGLGSIFEVVEDPVGFDVGIDLSKAISVKDEYDNGKRTLTLDVANKGGDSLKLKTGLTAKLSDKAKASIAGASAQASLSEQANAGLKIENYDPTNINHLKQVGLFALVPATLYTSSVFFNRAIERVAVDVCNTEAHEIGLGLSANANIGEMEIAGIKGSIWGYSTTSAWKWRDSYDYTGNSTYTTSKSLKVSAGEGLGSGIGTGNVGSKDISVKGKIGGYAYGYSASNSKEISAKRSADSQDFTSISYKTYNGQEVNYILNQFATDTYTTVTYSGDDAKNIFLSNPDLAKWANGGNPFINIQDTINIMHETGNIALVSETTKNKELAQASVPIGVNLGVSLGISFGVSGEHSYSWCDATGALYNNTVYTTCVSDVDENKVESSADGLDDLFLEAANTVLAEMVKNIITKNGRVSEGVQNDSVEVTGDCDVWVVVLSTIPSTSQGARSISQEDSYTILSLLSETDGEDTIDSFSTVGNPYEVTVYTDDSQTTLVTSEKLAESPVTLTFHYTTEMLKSAGAEEDAEVMLLRYDRENDIYICVSSAVQDRQNMTVTANMAENGEYILAVGMSDETPSDPKPPTPKHNHNWATAWSNNPTHHWHECSADGCPIIDNSEKSGYAAHVYDDDTDTTCNDCGYTRTVTPPAPGHTHSWAKAWSNNPTHHWHECSADGCPTASNSEKDGYAVHTSDGGKVTTAATAYQDGVRTYSCVVCGYVIRTESIPATGGSSFGGGSYSSGSSSYQITASSASNGTVTVSPKSARSGAKVTITATPDDGYEISSVTVKNSSGRSISVTDNGDGTYTFTMPTGRVTVSAAFAPIEYQITTTTSNGTVIVTPTSAKFGEEVTISVTPDNGYTTDGVTVTDSDDENISVKDNGDGTYTFTMPSSRVTVDVTFVPIQEEPTEEPAEEMIPWVNPFTDVTERDWFYGDVAYVEHNGLMNGVGDQKFDPNGTTTRGMIMTILARMSGVDTSGGSPWYQPGIEWAMQAGVSDGTSPEADITREQFATMLWRYVGEPEITGDLSVYPDAGDVHNWAGSAMIWAVQNGIINGSDGKLEPQGNALRSQAAAMLTRYCQKYRKVNFQKGLAE